MIAPIAEEDGGGEIVELGLSRADQVRHGVYRIILMRGPDEPPIELHHNLIVTVVKVTVENWWKRGPTVIVDGTAEIVQYTPKFYVRVDGISMPDCRNLKDKFGPEFPELIASDPGLLSKTRYSPQKQDLIVRACRREIVARQKDTVDVAAIVAKLCACGVSKSKARRLAAVYDPAGSPYQWFLRGALSYLQADRVARLIDPERAVEDRAFLLIIDQFVSQNQTHIIISQREIFSTVWTNFGVGYLDTEPALDRLVALGIVRRIDRPGLGPAVIAPDARIVSPTLGGGVIVSVIDDPAVTARYVSQCVSVKFDDGTRRIMASSFLRSETTVTLFGLSRLVEAEEQIADILSHNAAIELSDMELAEIEWVLDHAAELLNRPGFIPNAGQRQGVIQAFRYRFSIVTGPPGTGKTAIVALIAPPTAANARIRGR